MEIVSKHYRRIDKYRKWSTTISASTINVVTKICGNMMTDRSDTFHNKPSVIRKLCIWRISVEENLQIILTIDDVTVQRTYGWFRVFDGESCGADILSFESGRSPNLPESFTSTGNNLVIMTYGIQMKAHYNTGNDEYLKPE
ncbi:hypothetical protein EG68_08238 [Paragonimus skrjabini miyazakii]|uniref:CUB domain-containing protein n=1 Tax=Paragonimus skrjabini miyazakii TaxID=59628 RepID=A0A8S9YQ92_9TREM|nr:hypothetical protein EG68_08238 [Paragonimus skrjabini miyazakii]